MFAFTGLMMLIDMRNKCKNVIKDIIAILLFPLAIILILHPLIFKPGIPFAGDTTYYAPIRQPFVFYSWSDGRGPYIPIGILHRFLLWLLTKTFGLELAVKLWLIITSSLSGVSMYFATKFFLKYFRVRIKYLYFPSLISAFFYMLAFTNPAILYCASNMSWPYIVFPLLFVLIPAYLDNGGFRHLLAISILVLLGNPQPITNILLLLTSILYFVFQSLSSKNILALAKRLFILILLPVLINAYWLIPNLVGYLKSFSFAEKYTTEKLISMGSLRFLSHWKLLDVLMVGEGPYYFFWHHPRNYTILNVIIPLLSALSLVVFRRNKGVIFVSLIFVLGVFLAKGVWPPLGELYYYIAKHVPYFGAYLRNPTKFAPLVVSSYALLSSIGLAYALERIKTFKRKPLIYFAHFLLPSLLLLSVTYGTLLDLSIHSWHSYSPTYIPKVYDELNYWLSKHWEPFKVMWIPSGGAYVWKPYIITGFPDLLSSKPAVYFGKIYPEPLRSVRDIGELLKVLGVKYVIYHGDSISYPNEEIPHYLLNQEDLRIAYKLNYTYVPKDNSKASLPAREAGIVFNSSPFKLVSPEYIPRGKEVDIVIRYAVPSYVVEKGFKGVFHAGFNIRLRVVEAGTSYRDGKVYETSAYKQVMVSETEGYAYFRVKVPYNYPGTAVDIYADFYDGSFKPLTPVYFVGRLPVRPKAINIPFIVFKNTRYEGPVYTAELAVVYGLDRADILRVSSILNDYAPILINASIDVSTLSLLKVADAFIYSTSELPKQLEEYLSDSSIKIIYVYPISKLSLPTEKPIKGPVERDDYTYNETPLTPLGDFVLERGKSKIVTFRYRLPRPVVEKGFKGKFWAGFGMILLGYPHGVAPPLNQKNMYRVFEVPIYNYTLINDYEGLVSFNVTVPSNFNGSAVDVYVWFYDGSFKRISPIYYVGTFNVKGVTLLRSQQGIPVIHIVNDSLTIPIYLPKDGECILYLRAKGSLRIKANNTDLLLGRTTDAFDNYYVKLYLNRGLNRITLSTSGEAFIESIAVYESSLDDSSSSGIHQVLSYKKVNPTHWEVVVNASKPFVLVFTEPYDRLWRAYINGKELKPIPIFGLVNGFVVNETGVMHIRIYYTLQTYYLIGMATSAGTFIALLAISLSPSIGVLRRKALKTINRKT
jgi:hypothetical protein